MFSKIDSFLGRDIKAGKYALADDPKFGRIAADKLPDKWVFSTCGYCGVGCGLYIGVKEGKAVYTKGNPKHPVNIGTLCLKGLSEHETIESSDRVTTPMIRTDGKLKPASWDESFLKVSNEFKRIAKEHGPKAIGVLSSGQLLMEGFYALGKFTQIGLQTNNYDGNTTLCMASAMMGYKQSFGSDGAVGSYEDFEHAKTIVLIGANIADNHPVLKLHIEKNPHKPKIVVVDPRQSKTSQMADIFVPLKPRTDLALLNGIAHIILDKGWENKTYLKDHANNLDELKKHLLEYFPKRVADITGISTEVLYELAALYAQSDAVLTAWTMGVNQSSLGSATVSAINNLHLLTGQIGFPGAAPFSLTGQCNAMGTREGGFTSSIPGYRDFTKAVDRSEYAKIANVPEERVPKERGYKYAEIIEAIERGEIKALWVVATIPLVSFVNKNSLRKALKKLDLLVVQDAYFSDTAQIADVIFSTAIWGEKDGVYTNSERRCNRVNKAVEPLGDSKSDFHIIVELSRYFEGINEMLFPNWSKEDAFNEWKAVSKGRLCDYSGMTYELLEEKGGLQWPCNEAFPQGSPRLYTKEIPFRTANGKANLIVAHWEPMSEDISKDFPVILNTGRTVEQWHTRTKTRNIDILNNLCPEAWVDLSPADALKLGVDSGDRISISSARGLVKDVIVRKTATVREGQIFIPFHFNEQLVNTLTQSEFCPISGQPNYKQTAVQLHSAKKGS
jgi:assimilatory nitrate reductase catalytic subunit